MMFHPKHVLIKYEFQKHRMDHQSNIHIRNEALIEPIGNSEKSDFPYVYIILTFAHLGAWLAESQMCFKVTARHRYELCCQSLFESVAA